MSNTIIINSKSEIGAGTNGASLGVDALKYTAINQKNHFFANRSSIDIINENHLIFDQNSQKYNSSKRLKSMARLYEDFCLKLEDVYKTGNFPIVLAGDHSSAGGTIAGIKNAYPHKRLGVIWVDAHADLHSPYTSPTGNIHGMPLAVSLGIDNIESKRNEITDETVESWNVLKNNANICPKIIDDIVIIGVRDTEKEEKYLIDKHNIKTIKVDQVRANGVVQSANDALDHLEYCDIIYVSFDVDSMDCDLISHGTGTPVINGFSEKETTELLLELCKSPKLCCFEITEINPLLDEKTNTMVETGLRILEKITHTIESKFQDTL
jgi:arginase